MESKVNNRNMIIRGLIGLFLGITVSIGVSANYLFYNERPNNGYMVASFQSTVLNISNHSRS